MTETSSKPKVVIVGAGAIGSVMGGRLSRGGLDVTLVDLWKEHVDRINAEGLRLLSDAGEEVIRVRATTDIGSVAAAHVVIIQCKSLHTSDAAKSAAPLFGKQTVAITFQNGLGNEEMIAGHVGKERVLAGLTVNGANVLEPGVVKSFSNFPSPIGEIGGGITPRVERIAAAFTAAGVPTVASANIMREKWKKLFLNVGLSATSAITDLNIREMMSLPPLRELILKTIEEAVVVARRVGYEFTTAEATASLMQILESGSAAENKSSVCIDLRQRRKTEIDFINGAVARIGGEHGIPTPLNQTQIALVRGLESRFA